MSAHTQITKHIAGMQSLTRILKTGSYAGAGICVTVSVGANGSPVALELAADTEQALEALLTSQRATLELSAALTRSELRDAQAALQAYAEFSSKNPLTRGV